MQFEELISAVTQILQHEEKSQQKESLGATVMDKLTKDPPIDLDSMSVSHMDGLRSSENRKSARNYTFLTLFFGTAQLLVFIQASITL